MFSSIRSRALVGVAASSVLAFGVAAGSASAATNQSGLVNVSASDVTVPIGIAANVCQVSANVLSSASGGQFGQCSAVSQPSSGGGHGGSTNQTGLVNISLSGITVPVGVAANVCQVSVNVLSLASGGQAGRCSAVSQPAAL